MGRKPTVGFKAAAGEKLPIGFQPFSAVRYPKALFS